MRDYTFNDLLSVLLAIREHNPKALDCRLVVELDGELWLPETLKKVDGVPVMVINSSQE